jgi:hypothetical protein
MSIESALQGILRRNNQYKTAAVRWDKIDIEKFGHRSQ